MRGDIELERLIHQRDADRATIATLTAQVAQLQADLAHRHPHAYYADTGPGRHTGEFGGCIE